MEHRAMFFIFILFLTHLTNKQILNLLFDEIALVWVSTVKVALA